MSMISGQINELRAMAQLEKSLERPAIARILGDAADTIWELRDDLQRANAENAKLRELMRDMFDGMCMRGPDCRGCEHYELHEGQCFVGECEYHRRMRELGVEVDG